MLKPVTVLLVRSGDFGWSEVRQALREMPGVRLAGVATGLRQARAYAADHRPDLVLAAATVEGSSIGPFLHELRRDLGSAIKFAVFANRLTAADVAPLTDLGHTSCFLWGDLDATTLPACLQIIVRSAIMAGSPVAVEAFASTLRPPAPVCPRTLGIMPSQMAVLKLMAAGHKREVIARERGVCVKTVNRNVEELKVKLGAEDLFALAMKATQYGLIP